MKKDLISKAELKYRGWTEKAIKELLPEPTIRENSKLSLGERTFFEKDVVYAAESSEAWKNFISEAIDGDIERIKLMVLYDFFEGMKNI